MRGAQWQWRREAGNVRALGTSPRDLAEGLGGGEQRAARLVEIAQGEEHEESGGIFGQAAEAHARVVPELFDDAEGELDFGAHGGLLAVAVFLPATELTERAARSLMR